MFDYPWQSPATVAHSWGYHTLETQWKSTTTLLKSLRNNVSLNGNFMLNIGPKGNGDLPYEISQRLLEMGQWLDVNGESVYGSEGFGLRKDLHDWGKITFKNDTDGNYKLYLHIIHWPFNNNLSLTGISTKSSRAYVLRDKLKSSLYLNHYELLTEINLSGTQPDTYITVIVLEYDQKPKIVEGLMAKSVDGGYSLNHKNVTFENGDRKLKILERGGTTPEHIEIKDKYVSRWEIYVDKPCKMNFDVSYSYQGEKPGGQIKVKASGASLVHKAIPTGLTVGEPNQSWHIDNYTSHPLVSKL